MQIIIDITALVLWKHCTVPDKTTRNAGQSREDRTSFSNLETIRRNSCKLACITNHLVVCITSLL